MAPPDWKSVKMEDLAQYDDIVTEAIVDRVYFWAVIRKNGDFRVLPRRDLNEAKLASIIRQHVVHEKDVPAAVEALMELPGIQKGFNQFSSKEKKQQLKEHLTLYTQIYLPDCKFEVTTTNRYTIDTEEAAVTARKSIKRGETIEYLVGRKVTISEAQENALKRSGRNFSIIQSSRKKGLVSIFLGPARFANHDCEPNCRLDLLGQDRVKLVARRDIAEDDEITVDYSDDYFGLNNVECLCATCEKNLRNGWSIRREEPSTSQETITNEVTILEESTIRLEHDHLELNLLKSKSLFDSGSLSRTGTPDTSTTVTKREKEQPDRVSTESRRASIISLDSTRVDAATEATVAQETTIFIEVKTEHTEEITIPQIITSDIDTPEITEFPRKPREPSRHPQSGLKREISDESVTASSLHSSTPAVSTPATSLCEDSVLPSTEAGLIVEEPPLTDLSEFEVDESSQTAIRRSTSKETATPNPHNRKKKSVSRRINRYALVLSPEPEGDQTRPAGEIDSTLSVPRRIRIPGDYINTQALLANASCAWVDCSVCSRRFVQENSYEPRAGCRRCERHLKLYGFLWPKTDFEGTNDPEYRVSDHREIGEFVRKRKRDDEEEEGQEPDQDLFETRTRRIKQVKRDTLNPDTTFGPSKAPIRGGIWKGWVDPAVQQVLERKNPKKALKLQKAKKAQKSKVIKKKPVKKVVKIVKKVTTKAKVTIKRTKPAEVPKPERIATVKISSRGRKIIERVKAE